MNTDYEDDREKKSRGTELQRSVKEFFERYELNLNNPQIQINPNSELTEDYLSAISTIAFYPDFPKEERETFLVEWLDVFMPYSDYIENKYLPKLQDSFNFTPPIELENIKSIVNESKIESIDLYVSEIKENVTQEVQKENGDLLVQKLLLPYVIEIATIVFDVDKNDETIRVYREALNKLNQEITE